MTTTDSSADVHDAHVTFWQRMRRVAFWSVLIGIALELAILGLAALSDRSPGSAASIAQIASKVSWSYVVCLGISLGAAASNGRAQLMGFLGFLSGPAGFAVARSVHKGTLQAIADGPIAVAPDLLSPFLLAGIKALEYGVFGLWLGRISKVDGARLSRYLGAGAVIGCVFGALFLTFFVRAKPDAGAIEIVSKGVNELAFPIGCAFVLFVTKRTRVRVG